MRLLLIGFSKQNAQVLKLFCKTNFKVFQAEPVVRQFSNNLQLILPKLSITQQSAAAYIIDLNGVGMSIYDPYYIEQLIEFVGKKPCILVPRRNIPEWHDAKKLLPDSIVFLDYPYSKETAQSKFKALLLLVNLHLDVAKPSLMNAKATSGTSISSTLDTKHTSVKSCAISQSALADKNDSFQKNLEAIHSNPDTLILSQVIGKYYPSLLQISLTKNALTVWAQTQPMKLNAGAHTLLINPLEHRVIISKDSNRVLEYLMLTGRYLVSAATSIKIESISKDKFDTLAQKLLHSSHKNYSLNTMLWQVASSIVSEQLELIPHLLPMKVKFLPNFVLIDDVPSYVYPVLSSCLSKPRTISNLQQLFPDVAQQQLNRLMVIAMLSGIVDSWHLSEEAIKPLNTNAVDKQSNNKPNKDVKKAQKTGFFKRLLHKLSL